MEITALKKLAMKLNLVNKNIWFLCILILSAFLYLHKITFSDMWNDESFTYALVKHPFGDIAGLIAGDYHPPLYFYALKLFILISGVSVFSIRLFSVIAVLFTMVMVYFTGQRIFGKSGALYFCLLIMSLPMLASFSIEARMYTWGCFSVTGVFLYAILFMKSNKKIDLILLMLFSIISAYIHYYALIAALWTNIFVMTYLLKKKNRIWRTHFLYSIITAILYLPWVFVLINHIRKVEQTFWIPVVTWDTVFSCFVSPFSQKYWSPVNWEPVIIIYLMTFWVIYRNFIKHTDGKALELGLALFIFGSTIITTGIASVFFTPVLYIRYITIIVLMLLIPPTLFLVTVKNNWIKVVTLLVVLFFGIKISIEASSFSYGPYKQSIEHAHNYYPEAKKIFHVLETTVGPFNEYNKYGSENYWYQPESTLVYTNMNVFYGLHTIDSIEKVLKKGEMFIVVNAPVMPFNEKNMNHILSESRVVDIDTVVDYKVKWSNSLVLYVLRYK